MEKVWDWLKDCINGIDPLVLRVVVWEAVDNERILEQVSGKSMRERCQAAIDTNGYEHRTR
jgi:hypothetical protein